MGIFAKLKTFCYKDRLAPGDVEVCIPGAIIPLFCSPYACSVILALHVKSEDPLVRPRFGRYAEASPFAYMSHSGTHVPISKVHTDRSAEIVLPGVLHDAAHDPEVLCIRLSLHLTSASLSWTVYLRPYIFLT